jgi:ADP-heptose:LPS heptosyltransferase
MYFRLKRLEQATNRLCVHVLSRLLRDPSSARPDWSASPHRVLYLRHDRIGDMIVSTSLINAIARSHPTITLDVLASRANAPVLDGNPNVSSVIVWDKFRIRGYPQLLRELRHAHYDAVIDCTTLDPLLTTLLLMITCGARYRIGIGGRSNDDALTVKVSPSSSAGHHIDRSAVLATAFGVSIDSVDWRPTLFFSDEEISRAEHVWSEHEAGGPSARTRRLLVNISAGLPVRRWPEKHFIELLKHVRMMTPTLNVVIICGRQDVERAGNISEMSGVPLVSTPQLRDALALVATTDLVLTPDTSIGHAASACRKPAVILFLQGTEAKWGRYRIPGRNVSSVDQTLASLPLEPVRDAVDELIQTDWNTCSS